MPKPAKETGWCGTGLLVLRVWPCNCEYICHDGIPFVFLYASNAKRHPERAEQAIGFTLVGAYLPINALSDSSESSSRAIADCVVFFDSFVLKVSC